MGRTDVAQMLQHSPLVVLSVDSDSRIVPPTPNIPNGIEHQTHLLGPVPVAGNAQAIVPSAQERLFDRTSVLAGTIGLRQGRAGPADPSLAAEQVRILE